MSHDDLEKLSFNIGRHGDSDMDAFGNAVNNSMACGSVTSHPTDG